jgi:hypothetical protein
LNQIVTRCVRTPRQADAGGLLLDRPKPCQARGSDPGCSLTAFSVAPAWFSRALCRLRQDSMASCENQLLELRRYCDARGWIVSVFGIHAITRYTDDPFLSFPAGTGRQPHQSGWQGIPLPASARHGATRDSDGHPRQTTSGCSVIRLLVGRVATRRGPGHTWSPYTSADSPRVLRP